jgi:hypothetical protein
MPFNFVTIITTTLLSLFSISSALAGEKLNLGKIELKNPAKTQELKNFKDSLIKEMYELPSLSSIKEQMTFPLSSHEDLPVSPLMQLMLDARRKGITVTIYQQSNEPGGYAVYACSDPSRIGEQKNLRDKNNDLLPARFIAMLKKSEIDQVEEPFDCEIKGSGGQLVLVQIYLIGRKAMQKNLDPEDKKYFTVVYGPVGTVAEVSN